MTEAAPHDPPPRAGRLAALALLLAGLAFAHGGIALTGGDGVPGDLGDLRLNALILEHGRGWLAGDPLHARLFSPPWFWPHGNTLAYSENLLGTLPLYALARSAGLSSLGAVQAWMVACSLSSFGALYALARALGASRLGAALGGFLFAFALSRGAQAAQHIQLLPHAGSALCLLAAVRGRPLLAAAALAWQAWCSVYLGFFLALEAGLALLAAIALPAARAALAAHLRERWRGWALALLLAALLVAPLAPPYLAAMGEVGGGHARAHVAAFLPSPASWVLPAPHAAAHAWLRPVGAGLSNPNEQALFAGFAPWVALGAALVAGARRGGPGSAGAARAPAALVPLLAAGPLAALVTLSVDGLSLWHLVLAWVPGASAIRAVARVGLVELIPLGLALAWAATALEARAARRGSRAPLALPLALAALVVVENAGLVPHGASKAAMEERAAAVAGALEGRDCDAFLAVPGGPADDPVWLQLDAMAAADLARRPTLCGYSAWPPPGWAPLAFATTRTAAPLVARWLAREGRDPASLRVTVVTPRPDRAPPRPGE